MSRFRRFVIGISELLAVLAIALVTLGAAYAGYKFIHLITGQADQALIGLLLGACLGFLLSALPAAAMFMLGEIAHNSHKTFLLLEENLTSPAPPAQAQTAQQPIAHRSFRIRPMEPTNRPV